MLPLLLPPCSTAALSTATGCIPPGHGRVPSHGESQAELRLRMGACLLGCHCCSPSVPQCEGRGHSSCLLDQHHSWCPQVPLHTPGGVCPFLQGRLCVPNLVSQVWSCTAHEAPSPAFPTLTARRGSKHHRSVADTRMQGSTPAQDFGGLLPS